MNEHDKKFKKNAQNIGVALLVFIAMYQTLYIPIYQIFHAIVHPSLGSGTVANIVTEISTGLMYLAVFLVPALICLRLNKNVEAKAYVRPKPKCSPSMMTLTVFACIGIITAAAYVNSILASALGVSGNVLPTENEMAFVDFLLSAITLALVPGFCEEFLFRKTILSALSPYGEGFAIIASSILFGLMHQNVLQIFYATMAGIVLGCAYSRTRSFLCVFLIHFSNNLISVIQQFFASNYSEKTSNILGITLTLIVFAAGFASVLMLIIKEAEQKKTCTDGFFEKIEIPSVNYTKYELSTNQAKAFFLSPTVLIFTIISASLCLAQIFL